MIEIKNLTKRYDDFEALSNLNLTIPSGSIFGLIGVNGAGKSTLLRTLAGVFKAEEGQIFYDGEEVYNNEKLKRQIFFMPDEPYYATGMNGEKLAELYRSFYDFNNEVFLNFVKEFSLNLKTPIRSFSKGMKRRLFVSIAFACSPKYLLLDEVFDGLDPGARLQLKRGLIDMLDKNKGTAIIASHSLRELEDICDCFGLIDGKRVVDSGSLSNYLDQIYKFQVAFNSPILRGQLDFEVLSFEQNGRVATITAKGEKQQIINKIKALNPILIDEMPVDFEEYFISKISKTQGGN